MKTLLLIWPVLFIILILLVLVIWDVVADYKQRKIHIDLETDGLKPTGHIAIEGNLTPDEIADFKKRWRDASNKPNKIIDYETN
jgi:hypothetical protein